MIVPLLLMLCALIGIIGYINLAWAIAVRLGWLILVVIGLALVRNILRGLLKTVAVWFNQRNPDSAPYWEKYILGPTYRLTLLLVVRQPRSCYFTSITGMQRHRWFVLCR